MVCSRLVGTVHDLRRSNLAIADRRPRTNVNETEMEATPPWAEGVDLQRRHLQSPAGIHIAGGTAGALRAVE